MLASLFYFCVSKTIILSVNIVERWSKRYIHFNLTHCNSSKFKSFGMSYYIYRTETRFANFDF